MVLDIVCITFLYISVAFGAPNLFATSVACDLPVKLDSSTNIWNEYALHPNSIYRATVTNAVENITNQEDKAKALSIANTGSFIWIENSADISKIDIAAEDVPCKNILGLVLAGLPFKSCEVPKGDLGEDPWNYIEDFINPIIKRISSHNNTAFAIILEPGVLPNYALKPEAECGHVKDAWYLNVPKALKSLDLQNVIIYLDGAHGGIFGWTGRSWQGTTSVVPEWFHGDEGSPIRGAAEFTATWQAAGPLTQFRGLAVNVRNYNAWDTTPGESFEGENTCYDLYNKARNEKRYLERLKEGLKAINSSMPFHNIIDTSRNGQLGLRYAWSDWCNIRGAGNGRKPDSATNDPNLDAFIWATGLGISDGASDPNLLTYQGNCVSRSSFTPMPERGEFSPEYFKIMIQECRDCAKRREDPRLLGRCG